jgi:hypothetical protein
MLYLIPDFFSNLCTAATSFDTEAVGVPMGMRQKSAVHAEGVGKFKESFSAICFRMWRS